MATFTQMRDEMKTCPYNPLHRVSSRRLQQHIVKCSKNSANPILQDCPFNALHKIPANQLQQHILLCKDSRQVIREIEESRNRTVPKNSAVIHRTENPVSSEDWDKEVNNGDEPKGYVIPGLVDEDSNEETNREFRIKTNIEIQCMKPAERKKYYKQMVEKAKAAKELETANQERKSRASSRLSTSESETLSSDNNSVVKSESSDPDLRKPNTMPFVKFQGIGRGSTPSSAGNRQIGIGRGNAFSIRPNSMASIKREQEDSESDGVKRFSPDLN